MLVGPMQMFTSPMPVTPLSVWSRTSPTVYEARRPQAHLSGRTIGRFRNVRSRCSMRTFILSLDVRSVLQRAAVDGDRSCPAEPGGRLARAPRRHDYESPPRGLGVGDRFQRGADGADLAACPRSRRPQRRAGRLRERRSRSYSNTGGSIARFSGKITAVLRLNQSCRLCPRNRPARRDEGPPSSTDGCASRNDRLLSHGRSSCLWNATRTSEADRLFPPWRRRPGD